MRGQRCNVQFRVPGLPGKSKVGSLGAVALSLSMAVSLPLSAQQKQSLDGKSDSGGAQSLAAVAAPETLVGAKIGRTKSKINPKYDLSKIGERGIGDGVNFYSMEKEIALGKQLSNEIDRQSRIIQDPIVEEYVNRVAQNIVHNSDAKVPFVIKVVQSDEVNAFALPGGYFYVNSGLILAAENESELVGVMAHEIAHVAARHATRNETKRDIWNLASIPLIFVGGPIGYAVQQAAGLAVPMGFMKFSRDAEREADLLGLQYDYASGYDPATFVQFFEKMKLLEKQRKGFVAKAFSTHPMTEDRIKRAQEEIQTMLPAKDEYIVDTSDFQQVKARVAMLTNVDKHAELGKPTLHHSEKNKDGDSQGDRPVLKKKQD